MNNKKGSTSVFLVFILAAMVGVTATFIYAARQTAYTGISDGALNMSIRSILSEFDITLKDRYGLMAFEKNGMEVALEINDYIDYTLYKEKTVKKIQVSFGDYPLSNVVTLKKQILDYMEIAIAEEVFEEDEPDYERNEINDRTLRNKSIINALPSIPFEESGQSFLDSIELLKDKLESVDDIFDEASKTYIIDMYIMNHFKYATGDPVNEDSFFDHEVEYIIAGNYSNRENRNTVEKGLKLIRTGLNSAYIYKDDIKRSQTLAAAEIIAPEAAPATQALIIAAWAAAEADNDVKLLLKGRPVPFMKDDASWATDLDKVLENITEECIDTGNQKGLYYSDYMMIFLHFQNENLKLARIADLIQINMKGTYDRNFLMKTAKGGLHLNAEICGKKWGYESCY